MHGDPRVVQLTKNYRSHGKILEVANSLVDIIELFFPKTIDKLQRESSEIDGPKPIILEGYDPDDLTAILQDNSGGKTPKFGSNQVVIVRNQEAKKTLPLFFKGALCLTVYETKGLEFEDVILYNFFTDSPCQIEWRIIKDIEVTKERKRKTARAEENLTLNELDIQEYRKMAEKANFEEGKIADRDDEYEEVTTLYTTKERENVDRNFSRL